MRMYIYIYIYSIYFYIIFSSRIHLSTRTGECSLGRLVGFSHKCAHIKTRSTLETSAARCFLYIYPPEIGESK